MQASARVGADGGVAGSRALIAVLDQPQARQRDVLVLGQAPREQRQQIVERALLRQLEQQLLKRVGGGAADFRPQHAFKLREGSFPRRKFAVENTSFRGARGGATVARSR